MAKGQEDGKSEIRRGWYVRRWVTASASYGAGLGLFAGLAVFALRNAGRSMAGGRFGSLDPVGVGIGAAVVVSVFLAVVYGYGLANTFRSGGRYIDGASAAHDLPEPVRFTRADDGTPTSKPAGSGAGRAARGGAGSASGSRALPEPGSLLARRAAGVPNEAEVTSA